MNVTTFLLMARAQAGPKHLEHTLNELLSQRFTAEASTGRTVISTTEAGGTVTFAVPESMTPADVAEVAAQALMEFHANPKWQDGTWFPRRLKRLRASFSKATI